MDPPVHLGDSGHTLVGVVAQPGLGAWTLADAFLGVFILLGVLVLGNMGRMPRGVEEFLAVRLSLKNFLLLALFGASWPTMLWLCGLYNQDRLRTGQGEWPRVLVASTIAAVVALAFPLTSQSGAARPIHALIFWMIVAPGAIALRLGARAWSQATRRGLPRRTVIIGSGPLAAWAYRGFNAEQSAPREVLGYVDTTPQSPLQGSGLQYLGAVESLERLLMHEVVDEVFIALPMKSQYERIQKAIDSCEKVGVPATYPAFVFRSSLSGARIEQRGSTPVLAHHMAPDDYRLLIKRLIDVSAASALIIMLAPLLLLIAAAIKLSGPGPILFRQERYGYMKRRFTMLKFRTMVENAERLQSDLEPRNEATGPAFKIRDDPRVTIIGRLLRRASLDELPQLWHVLRGQMSLVGPRPMSLRDVSRFHDPWLMRRFSVPPGLTCLWQVGGRSALPFEKWIALDLHYIDNWSLGLDFVILLRTVPAVLSGRGAN